ncbi:hypothetical protein JK359_37325 [Streptomyces actinomycinicus]|uniref:Uncharacterized protein n=1 Tax=Streptomyces actinomycinicus TaxID=1695166 RepID=A0A937JT87_9ACTN|nr:hypothetical protein [Streptomyces actinomycinicus]MBL1087537.1 hypothetical protein [Streptomyces actinomycinicus]
MSNSRSAWIALERVYSLRRRAASIDLIDEQRYTRPLGVRLHKLAASLSQTVAWIRFDHGQHDAASRY